MPANYLEEDEELYPRYRKPGDPEDDEAGAFGIGPTAEAPPVSAMGPDLPKPSPELRSILSSGRPPLSPNDAPVVKDATTARNKYAEAVAAKPAMPQPKWWQRALAGAAGAAAGWSNAAGRTKHPIDIEAMGKAITAPGYDRATADWQNKVVAADAANTAAQGNEQAWWKNRQLGNQEEREQAQSRRDDAFAQYESERNSTAERTRKAGNDERLEAQLIKPWGEDAQLQKEGEPVPAGMETTRSITQPGMVYVHPPRFVKLTDDLAPYATGRKPGDVVPYSEFKRAQASATKDTLAQNKPTVERATTEVQLAQIAADPTKTPQERASADAALKRLDQSRVASRSVVNNILPGITPQQSKLTGDAFLGTLPTGTAAQVKAIAEGRQTQLPRGKELAAMMALVNQYDPGFSNQRAEVRKAFTTGPDGRNIGNLNTAVVHLGRLGDTAEALKNGSFTPGNELYNYFKDKFGSPVVTNFGLLKDAVAGEMAAALKGTATDIEIEKMGRSIRAANSPEQMSQVINEGMGILHDKANTYDERYHALMPDDQWSPILPTAKAQLQKRGIVHQGNGGAAHQNTGGKSATTADVHAYAQAHPGMTDQQAQAAFVAKGYVIR